MSAFAFPSWDEKLIKTFGSFCAFLSPPLGVCEWCHNLRFVPRTNANGLSNLTVVTLKSH